MPFPTTTLLDDFNRANNPSLGASWSEGVIGSTTRAEISSNQVTTSGAGGSSACAYIAGDSPIGNNIAMNATVTGFGISAATDILGLAATKVSDTTKGYRIEFDNSASPSDTVVHFVNSSGTAFATVTCVGMGGFSVGDITGLVVRDTGSASPLEFWLNRGGTWTLYASTTATGGDYVAGPYYPGIRVKYDTDFLDDFGAGLVSVPSSSDDPPIGFLGRGAGW